MPTSAAGVAAAVVAQAAGRVCEAFDEHISEQVRKIFAEVFSDESLVEEDAGPTASLVKSCRRALELANSDKDDCGDRGFELTLAELLGDLWRNQSWRAAWAGNPHAAAELRARCPIKEVLSGAQMALSFGNAVAQDMYFSNFSKLACHAGMMQDAGRTRAYYRAILGNKPDFEGKVVMDVGSGTGLLAFFAVQAGAARVYCIEASPMAEVIQQLADANGWTDKIVVVQKILQEIRDGEVPEKVDVITSETLGNFLFAERGIETVIVARERWLKPDGKLYPAYATFCCAPFSDKVAFRGRFAFSKNLWTNNDFYGIDLSGMQERMAQETFRRPVSDQFHPDILKADCMTKVFDFRTLRSEELTKFRLDYKFVMKDTCILHGIAGWFEAHFDGSKCSVILSTSPWDTLTHWWMTRLLIRDPLAVNAGQVITGGIDFEASGHNSYHCTLDMECGGVRRVQDRMDLLDLDDDGRNPEYIKTNTSSVTQVALPNFEATKAKPCPENEELVKDPMRFAKEAALRSEAGDGNYEELRQSLEECNGNGQDKKQASDGVNGLKRRFGSQIKVNGKFFMLVNDPQASAEWTKPSTHLILCGSLGSSLLMTPQEQPFKCLVEYGRGESGITARFYRETGAAIQMMRAYVMKHQKADSPTSLTGKQLEDLETSSLYMIYEHMRAAVDAN